MKKLLSFCLALALLGSPVLVCAATVQPETTQSYLLLDALYRAQGVTTDGAYLYFGSNQYVFSCSDILKTTFDGTPVLVNADAIPIEAKRDLCGHIGGIDYADGKIYAAVEDNIEKDGDEYNNPYVTVYDAQTLALLAYHRLPVAVTAAGEPVARKADFNADNGDIWLHRDGIPWVAVDTQRGVFYTAEWNNAKYLNVFDLHTFAFRELLPLVDENGEAAVLHRCQGADVYGGILYGSCDIGGEQPFVALDPATGVLRSLAARDLGDERESEDMCVFTAENKVYFISQYVDGAGIRLCFYDMTDAVPPAQTATVPVTLSFFQRVQAFFRLLLSIFTNLF